MFSDYVEKHSCNDCLLTFQTPHELQNHKRRFCINSGYDNLQGLAKIEYQGSAPTHKPVFSHKNHLQQYGVNSLTKIGQQDDLTASNLQKDMQNIHKFKRQLDGMKKYKHKEELDETLNESFAKLDRTQVSKNSYSESRLQQELKKYQKPVEEAISPPTFIDQLNMRNHTVLDKSNSTIARMPNKDKIQYAKVKLDELKGIKQLYVQNGGNKTEFRDNIDKMVDFYSKFLQERTEKEKLENQKAFNDSQMLIQSRCSTPILKLRDFNQKDLGESAKKSQIRKQAENSRVRNTQPNNQPYPQMNLPGINPQNNQGYYYPQAPPIIMVPYPQHSQGGQSESMRVLEKMIELKSQENKKLLQILLQDKKKNNQVIPPYFPYPYPPQQPLLPQQQAALKPNSTEKPRTDKKGFIDVDDDYQFKKSMIGDLISEQKVLLALQQQELDEFKLLSQLPKDLQEIKMKSAIKAADTRFQVEKEILKQKMARLAYQEQNQSFEEQRKLANDRWAGQERKKLLEKQLDRYVQNFQKQLNQDEEIE